MISHQISGAENLRKKKVTDLDGCNRFFTVPKRLKLEILVEKSVHPENCLFLLFVFYILR